MRIIAQVEIDPFCRAVLEKHWPNVARYNDVREFCRRTGDNQPEDEDGYVECSIPAGEDFGGCPCIGTDQFADECGWPDIIVGGDPCQANSNAKTHGRLADALGGEFVRIVAELHPRYVLRENPSAVRHDSPWPWERFANALTELGYVARPFRFRACCAGADHRRERMFVFAVDADSDSAGLEGNEREIVAAEREGRQDPDAARPNRWSATPRICRATDGVARRLVRLRSLGNSIVPQVAELIGRAIMEADQKGTQWPITRT